MTKPKTIRSKSGYHDVPATGDSVFLGKDVFPSESVRRLGKQLISSQVRSKVATVRALRCCGGFRA